MAGRRLDSGFETVKPPQHSVAVKVVQKDAGTPVEDAQVRLGVCFTTPTPTALRQSRCHRGMQPGRAQDRLRGAPSRVVDVCDDVTVEVEVVVMPAGESRRAGCSIRRSIGERATVPADRFVTQ